jgi:hypothetical protein
VSTSQVLELQECTIRHGFDYVPGTVLHPSDAENEQDLVFVLSKSMA